MAARRSSRCAVEHDRRSRRARLHGDAATGAAGAALPRRTVPASGTGSRTIRPASGPSRACSRSPARRRSATCVRITYAVHGRFTARMERELAEAARVWIKMPYGDFVIERSARRRAVRRRHRHHGVHGVPRSDCAVDGRRAVTLALRRAHAHAADLSRRRRALRARACRRSTSLYFVEDATAMRRPMATGRRLGRARCGRALRRPLDADFYISGPPRCCKAIGAGPAGTRRAAGGDSH